MKRFLIFHFSVGSGHTRAAIALSKGISIVRQDANVFVADAMKYVSRVVARATLRGYLDIIRTIPAVWSYMYKQAEREAVAEVGRQELGNLIRALGANRVFSLVEDFAPDTIVCTHPLPLAFLADLKRRGELDIPLVGVVTDLTVHPLWIYDTVDHYAFPHESVLLSPQLKDVPDDKIWITGVPIDPAFNEPVDRAFVRRELGFSPDDRVALVMGGGLGLGSVERVVRSLASDESISIIVVAGRNQALRDDLEPVAASLGRRMVLFGYTDRVHALMEASDVLLTKGGGLTIAEALAKKLPLVIVSPIPGQEERNTDFLVMRGAAMKAESAAYAADLTKRALDRPRLLAAMKAAAADLARPGSALELAALLVEETP